MPAPNLIRAVPMVILLLSISLAGPAAALGEYQIVLFDYDDLDTFTVSTSSYDYNAYTDHKLIAKTTLGVYQGTNATITLYDTDQTIQCQINVSESGAVSCILGNQTIEDYGGGWQFLPIGTDPTTIRKLFDLEYVIASIYADDPASTQTYLRLMPQSGGGREALVPLNNAIYRIGISAENDIEMTLWVAPEGEIYDQIEDRRDTTVGFLDFLGNVTSTIYQIVSIGYALIYAVLVQHFAITVALYETVIAAVAFNQSNDIFSAFRKFFRYNKAAIEFFARMIGFLVEIITRVINALKPI